MRLCIFEDSGAQRLEPISLTRPVFGLRCGAERLFERYRRQFGANEIGFWLRPPLADLWKLEQPSDPVNDTDWLRERPTVWVNGRWLCGTNIHIDPSFLHAGILNGQIAYLVIPGGESPDTPTIDGWLADWSRRIPSRNVGGVMLDYIWDVVEHNGDVLKGDCGWFQRAHGSRGLPTSVAIEGAADQFVVSESATIEPFVFADTRGGPVLIDKGAVIHSFTRLEGPCYVGEGSWIVGAKLRAGTSVGPGCRIGGEVEASVLQGHCNKYHDGFLGHSYVGEWVNLAAGTHTSDLRNDYDVVRVNVDGQQVLTGLTKVGSFIGDHSKTGLGALLNTGSMVGAFAHILPSGTFLPRVIPSFCQVHYGHLGDLWDLSRVLETAGIVMKRRGKTLTDAHKEFYQSLFESTMDVRHTIMRESEMRRLRRSV